MVKALNTLKISYGLLNFDVRLYSLRDKSDSLSFTSLSDCCRKETGLKRYCKACLNANLSWKTDLKGYKISKDNYIELNKSELETIERLDNGIYILNFIKADSLKPECLDKPYLLEADSKNKINSKLYSLFNEVLSELNLYAVVRAVIKGYEHFGILRHNKEGLILQLIERINSLTIENFAVTDKNEVNAIKGLVQENIKEFDFDSLKPIYADKVRELITAKSEGRIIEVKANTEVLNDTHLLDVIKLMRAKKVSELVNK